MILASLLAFDMAAKGSRKKNLSPYFPRDRELQDGCFSDVATLTTNADICEEVRTQGIKDSSYYKVAISTQDPRFCDKIFAMRSIRSRMRGFEVADLVYRFTSSNRMKS